MGGCNPGFVLLLMRWHRVEEFEGFLRAGKQFEDV